MKKIVPDPPHVLGAHPGLTLDQQQAAAHLRSAAERADAFRHRDTHDNLIASILARIQTARSLLEWADKLQREHSTFLA